MRKLFPIWLEVSNRTILFIRTIQDAFLKLIEGGNSKDNRENIHHVWVMIKCVNDFDKPGQESFPHAFLKLILQSKPILLRNLQKRTNIVETFGTCKRVSSAQIKSLCQILKQSEVDYSCGAFYFEAKKLTCRLVTIDNFDGNTHPYQRLIMYLFLNNSNFLASCLQLTA